ncbi:MAG TPA: hypothetical protein VIY48_07870, partial [Candidatus Paceibacterota bacterium]
MKLVELLKEAAWAELEEVSHGYLWYNLYRKHEDVAVFRFRIPFADTAGGTFMASEDNPKIFQRWIRKELELAATTEAEI